MTHSWNTGLSDKIRTCRINISNWKLLDVNLIPCISKTVIKSFSGFISSSDNLFSLSSKTKHVGIFTRFLDGATLARSK